jgi:hypothetical protein
MNTHRYTQTYIPWIHEFAMAKIGCGISHKDAKNTDKYSNNKTENTESKTTKPQANTFSKYCKDNTKEV